MKRHFAYRGCRIAESTSKSISETCKIGCGHDETADCGWIGFQKEPNNEPNTMTVSNARRAPAMPTITMSP